MILLWAYVQNTPLLINKHVLNNAVEKGLGVRTPTGGHSHPTLLAGLKHL